jgi:hypothetical protein
MTIVNTGKTDAKDIKIEVICKKLKTGESPTFKYDSRFVSARTGVLFPNDPFSFNASVLVENSPGGTMIAEPLTGNDFKEFLAGNMTVVTYARVTYSDIFGIRHWMRFCVVNTKPTADARSSTDAKCPEYNNEDNN